MSRTDLILLLPLVLAVLAAGALALVRLQRRRREARRVVEQPNSHYTAPAVREREVHEHWRAIDLDRIHEINRDEVVRLLEKVEAAGADALRPSERAFLDHMAKLARKAAPSERRPGGSLGPPELRHRPA